MSDGSTLEKLADRVRSLEDQVSTLKSAEADLRDKIAALTARLPAESREAAPAAPTPPRTTAPGRGRVLFMDDDEMIRELTGEKLVRMGYRVSLASSGEEAVSLFEKAFREGRGYDAVILDLMVSRGMDGKQTVRKLMDIDPDVRAVISSGYMNDSVISNFWEYGFKAALVKPYQAGALEKLLEAVIVQRD